MKVIMEMFSNVFIRVPVHSSTPHHEQGPGEGGSQQIMFYTGRLCPEV